VDLVIPNNSHCRRTDSSAFFFTKLRDGLFFPTSEGAYNNPDSEECGFYFFREGTNEYTG